MKVLAILSVAALALTPASALNFGDSMSAIAAQVGQAFMTRDPVKTSFRVVTKAEANVDEMNTIATEITSIIHHEDAEDIQIEEMKKAAFEQAKNIFGNQKTPVAPAQHEMTVEEKFDALVARLHHAKQIHNVNWENSFKTEDIDAKFDKLAAQFSGHKAHHSQPKHSEGLDHRRDEMLADIAKWHAAHDFTQAEKAQNEELKRMFVESSKGFFANTEEAELVERKKEMLADIAMWHAEHDNTEAAQVEEAKKGLFAVIQAMHEEAEVEQYKKDFVAQAQTLFANPQEAELVERKKEMLADIAKWHATHDEAQNEELKRMFIESSKDLFASQEEVEIEEAKDNLFAMIQTMHQDAEVEEAKKGLFAQIQTMQQDAEIEEAKNAVIAQAQIFFANPEETELAERKKEMLADIAKWHATHDHAQEVEIVEPTEAEIEEMKKAAFADAQSFFAPQEEEIRVEFNAESYVQEMTPEAREMFFGHKTAANKVAPKLSPRLQAKYERIMAELRK